MQNSNCRLPYPKELHGWNTAGLTKSEIALELFPYDHVARQLATPLSKYATRFRRGKGPSVEITPSYIYKIERVKEQIARFQGTLPVQLIFVRDPIEAAASHYAMQLRNGVHALPPTTLIEIDRTLWEAGSYRICSVSGFQYSSLIPPAKKAFPRTIVIDFSKFVSDPSHVHQTLGEVGVEVKAGAAVPWSNARVNSQSGRSEKERRNQWVDDFRGLVHSLLERSRDYYLGLTTNGD